MITIKQLKEDFQYEDAVAVEYKDSTLFIKQYLPAEDRFKMVSGILLLLGLDQGSYSPILSEILFETEVVKYYSNIIFDTDDQDDFFKTHDILDQTGVIDLVIKNIPVDEYEKTVRLYEETIEKEITYNSSIANVISKVITELPELLTVVGKEIKDFNPENMDGIVNYLQDLGSKGHI